ncbi:MAG TPA: PAS domain S-box protein [Pseudomonadales bacterium]
MTASSPTGARPDHSHASTPLTDAHLYRALFESAPGLFVVVDPRNYRILAVSDDYLAMTMRRRADLVGRIFVEAFPDDPENPEATGTANLIASFERVKSTHMKDAMAVQKHPIVNPQTGTLEERYWTPLNSPVFDGDGTMIAIIHRTEDITDYVQNRDRPAHSDLGRGELNVIVQAQELKRLNDELLESQMRLQAIFRSASLGIAATELDGRFTDANDAYCRMVGYTLDELKQLTALDLTHPSDRTHNLDLREELVRGDRPTSVYDKRYITKSGAIIWCRVSASVVRNAKGELTNLIAIIEDITAQVQSEETLRRVRTLERLGGRIARIGGWVVDYMDERRVEWAPEVYEMYEWTGTVAPPLADVLKLMHPANRQQVVRALEDCELRAKSFDLEVALVTFKGTPKWLRIVGEAELGSGGVVVRTIGAVQDITRQKAELLRNQQLTSQLFSTLESMSDAFYLLGRDWLFLYMNAEAERILNVDRHSIIGKNIFDEFPFFRSSPVAAGFENAFRTGEAYHAEMYWERLDLWVSISAYSSSDTLAVYFRSITAEKQLQTRIAESEQRLKYVTEAALDIVWDVDLPSGSAWYNDGLQKYGYAGGPNPDGAQFWLDKVHPDDEPMVAQHYARSLADPQQNVWNCRYRFRCANDKYIHIEDRAYIVRDGNGLAVRLVGGSTDITERLNMEEQLLQSQRLDSLGQLTGGIAHDFNNLLTVILGNAQLLQEQLHDQPKLRNLTNIIDIAATRGANLTRHLLAFSRKQALQPGTIDINKLLTSLKGMLSRTLGENIVINLRAQPALWPAFVDQNQLEVALLNLCINARDAMPDGGIVSLETTNVRLDEAFSASSNVAPGDYVLITITDTGAGIPADIIDHVFEPFFTTKDKGKGTGLGLSTVFGFVKQSNGHIDIYSEVGVGTTLRVYLPRSVEAPAESDTPANAPRAQGGSELILLVEDNELVRKFGQDMLKSLGYAVLTASDGRAALAILQERNDVKLLFTDVVMPGIGGPELARQAQKLHPSLKVLYTSGYTQDSMIHNGKLDAGVTLLEKPYNRSALAAKLREVLAEP